LTKIKKEIIHISFRSFKSGRRLFQWYNKKKEKEEKKEKKETRRRRRRRRRRIIPQAKSRFRSSLSLIEKKFP